MDKMIDGDGSVGSDGQRCFIQNEGPTLESFQMALTMLGISFSVRKHNGGRCKAVLLRKSTRHHVGRGSKETVQYKGRVWCPIIPETCTWVARRNGMPFITHNTFKQFSIAYVEWLKRLPGPQRMRALAILFLAAGLQGLPFAEDIEDIIDAIGQWLGYGTNTKKWIRQNAASWLGDGAGQFVTHGVSAFLPIDISARMGVGNLLPGTGLLKRSSTDKGRDIVEFLGPVGGVAEKIIKGKPDEALVPKAIQDAYKAYQMWTTGEYRNGDGQLIARDVTKGEAVAKGVGFNPDRIAVQGRKVWENSQDVRLVKDVESQITGKWAQGIVEKDPKKIAQAREELLDWNRKNPTMRIRIEKQQIQRRVSELRKTREERLIRRTSKELRGDVARDVKP